MDYDIQRYNLYDNMITKSSHCEKKVSYTIEIKLVLVQTKLF